MKTGMKSIEIVTFVQAKLKCLLEAHTNFILKYSNEILINKECNTTIKYH